MGSYPVKDVRPIVIRDKETKVEICRTCAINLARDIIEEFKKEDRFNGLYVDDLYEIYNERTGKVIEE